MHLPKKISLVLLVLICTFGLYSQSVVNKTITIKPSLSFQYYEHFKRLTLDSPDAPIEYLDGFNFEWGFNYKISVQETKLNTPLSDGSQFNYKLNRVISKTKVQDSTEFKLFLDPTRYYHVVDSSEQSMSVTLKQINDSTYTYFDKVEIEVPNHLKMIFSQFVEGTGSKFGNFVFINEKRIRLVKF